eukprot:359163-Amphidinium_carterae.1
MLRISDAWMECAGICNVVGALDGGCASGESFRVCDGNLDIHTHGILVLLAARLMVVVLPVAAAVLVEAHLSWMPLPL